MTPQQQRIWTALWGCLLLAFLLCQAGEIILYRQGL